MPTERTELEQDRTSAVEVVDQLDHKDLAEEASDAGYASAAAEAHRARHVADGDEGNVGEDRTAFAESSSVDHGPRRLQRQRRPYSSGSCLAYAMGWRVEGGGGGSRSSVGGNLNENLRETKRRMSAVSEER